LPQPAFATILRRVVPHFAQSSVTTYMVLRDFLSDLGATVCAELPTFPARSE
jgi:hypothetical protein